MRHRQRRRHRPGCPCRGNGRPRKTRGQTGRPPPHQRNSPSRPALPPAPSTRRANCARAATRSARPTRNRPRLWRQGRPHRPARDRSHPPEEFLGQAQEPDRGKQRHPRIARRRADFLQGSGEGLSRSGPEARALHHRHRRLASWPARKAQAHPLRGRAGNLPRHRLRHLPLRHLLQHHGGRLLHRLRQSAAPDGPRRRRNESLHHPRRRRPAGPPSARRSPTCCTPWVASSARPPAAHAAAAGSTPSPRAMPAS